MSAADASRDAADIVGALALRGVAVAGQAAPTRVVWRVLSASEAKRRLAEERAAKVARKREARRQCADPRGADIADRFAPLFAALAAEGSGAAEIGARTAAAFAAVARREAECAAEFARARAYIRRRAADALVTELLGAAESPSLARLSRRALPIELRAALRTDIRCAVAPAQSEGDA